MSEYYKGHDLVQMCRKGYMMASLKDLFDYQKFAGNSRLEAMIKDTESRYGSKLSIDDLELVSAAGTPDQIQQQKELLKHKKDHV